MEYQKMINLSDNTSNKQTKFRMENWVEMHDKSRGKCNQENQIRFKSSMLRSILCNYSDAYTLSKGTITVGKETDAAPRYISKNVILENCCNI